MEQLEVDKKKRQSKSEINAHWILNRINNRDIDAGGVFSLVTGSQGSGKTAVILSFLRYNLIHHPNEKVFFSNCYNAPLQFTKLRQKDIHYMVKNGSNVTFHDRVNHLKQVYPSVTHFDDMDDLFHKSKPGKCNAVFFGDRKEWMAFIRHLRSVGEWTSIYIDEISDIAASHQKSKGWNAVLEFALDLKEVRKCLMNVHSNTQSMQDIDYRVLTKVMCNIFLPGAQASKHSRIEQGAIDNLVEDSVHGNEAYIEYSGKFGKTIFNDIFSPNNKIIWEARNDRQQAV